ncbi:MAG: FG-GAP repeat protein [Pirellulales bacterium]
MKAAVRKGPGGAFAAGVLRERQDAWSRSPGFTYPDFIESPASPSRSRSPTPEKACTTSARTIKKPKWPDDIRANAWRYVDYDGDGKTDLVVGIDYWGDYNWENAYNGEKQSTTERPMEKRPAARLRLSPAQHRHGRPAGLRHAPSSSGRRQDHRCLRHAVADVRRFPRDGTST